MGRTIVRHGFKNNGVGLDLCPHLVGRSPLGLNQWRLNDPLYMAFVIGVFARQIVGWRASTSMKTQFMHDALEQAIWQRQTLDNKSLVHHSDRLKPPNTCRSNIPNGWLRLRSISPSGPSAWAAAGFADTEMRS